MSCRAPAAVAAALATLLALAACASAADGRERPRNLVRNGSFEEGDKLEPLPGWYFTSWGKIGPVAGGRVKKAHTGRYSLCIVSDMTPVDYAAYSDLLPPVEAAEFSFSFFYKTEGEPGATANFVSFEGGFLERQWNAPVVQVEKKVLPPSKQWRAAYLRVPRPSVARQSIVLFRVASEGRLYVDDVRVVEAEPEVLFQVELPGVVRRPPRQRVIRLRLTEAGTQLVQEGGRLVAHAYVTPLAGGPVSATAPFAPARATAELLYSLREDGLHKADIVLMARDQVTVHDGRTIWARPALDVHLTQPAFRGMLLPSLPWDGLTATCRVNADPGAGGGFALAGRLVEDLEGGRTLGSADAVTQPGEAAELRFDLDSLPAGKYRLNLSAAARAGGRPDWSASLPVLSLEPRTWEVGYDQDLRLFVDREPFFPVGIFDVYRRADLRRTGQGGLNLVVAPRAAVGPEYLSEAHACGLKVVASALQTNLAAWRGILDSLTESPALVGWLSFNEPAVRNVSVATAEGLYRDLAAADPYHPVLCSLTEAEAMPAFVDGTDIVLAASAPVPYWPLVQVAEQVQAARRAADGHKPVWAVIQTVGRAWMRGAAAGGLARAPTPEEMRCMTYLALLHGAQGIVYSSYETLPDARRAAFRLPDDAPLLWAGVCAVAEQLNALSPALLNGPTGPAQVSSEQVQAGSFQGDGWTYVIAVNTSRQVYEAVVTLPQVPAGELRALFTEREPQRVAGGQVSDRFLPYEVRIYRF